MNETTTEPARFTESNALLALVRGEEDEAREILAGMLVGELYDLARAAGQLGSLAQALAQHRRDPKREWPPRPEREWREWREWLATRAPGGPHA